MLQVQPYVDWFKWDDSKHPLSNAPEPKRRFIPSKSESKLVRHVKCIAPVVCFLSFSFPLVLFYFQSSRLFFCQFKMASCSML